MDLEAEFGWLLDAMETYGDKTILEHFGVKGMHWGVRKEKIPNAPIKTLGPDTIVRKTKSGDEITLSKEPTPVMGRFLARHNSKFKISLENRANFSIKDKDGKKIGDASVKRVSKDELNLVWLGIKKSERGKGYASAVMQASAEFGKKAGLKKLTLEVPGNSPDARHIYEKLGFKVTKEPTEREAKADSLWGGLTEMEYNFAEVKHSNLLHADRRSQLVVVAIPSENDPVWNVSSEKVPHMTLLYLGEDLNISDVDVAHVTEHVEYASSLMSRFGMDVDRRGTLGPKEADVLFFGKSYGMKDLLQFRHNLMVDNVINKLWHSATQFPEFTPHLTLGFPETPAKKDTRDYPGFSWVNFDRIALWTADSEGPTFVLKEGNYAMETVMAQSEAFVENFLEQSGVKGMKWGVHKSTSSASSTRVPVTIGKKNKLTTSGGVGHKPHTQAIEKVVAQQIAKKSGVHALSNTELQAAVTRMNLEQQFVRLSPQSKTQKAKKFVAETLLGVGKQQVSQAANTAASQQVSALLNKTKK